MGYSNLGKNTNIEIGNNNSEINVIISNDDMIKDLQEENRRLSADLVWADEQLKLKDILIDELIRRIKNA